MNNFILLILMQGYNIKSKHGLFTNGCETVRVKASK